MINILQLITFFARVSLRIYTIFLIIGFLGFGQKAKSGKIMNNKVEFVIVSIVIRAMRKSLFECINHTLSKFKDIPISVVVDEGAQLINELGNYVSVRNLPNTRALSPLMAKRQR